MPGLAGLPFLSPAVLTTAAWSLGIIPAGWLALRRSRDGMAWKVAGVLAISFLADGAALAGVDSDVVSNTYLFLQGSLLALALIGWESAAALVLLYAVTAVAAIRYETVTGFGLWLPTVVGVSVCWVASRWAAPLRWSVVLTFGGGLVAWVYWAWLAGHSPALAARGWWCFQAARLLGVLAFMAATWPTRVRSGCGCPA